MIKDFYDIDSSIIELINDSEAEIKHLYSRIDDIALYNQTKVLSAFQELKISPRHFNPSSGYGYGDDGRDMLGNLFAKVFGSHKAIVRPQIASATHAIAIALFAVLRPGDTFLSITGTPYDTMGDIIGNAKSMGKGSLKDFGINFDQVDLYNNSLNYAGIESKIREKKIKLIYIQRSRGYDWRMPLMIPEIEKMCSFIKSIDKDIIIMVDNCYGEFTDKKEPTQVGANMIVGSLIKNPGGGLAPTGAYIAGDNVIIELVANRITSPGIADEVGSYAGSYTNFYQGLFNAPTVVANSIKGAMLFSKVYSKLGFEVSPTTDEPRGDIIQAIKFGSPNYVIEFCKTIQASSPIDGYVVPEPWDMPGYDDPVIMAAGTFVQGASIELTADAPIREPYTVYFQGGLTYEHCKIAAMITADKIKKQSLN